MSDIDPVTALMAHPITSNDAIGDVLTAGDPDMPALDWRISEAMRLVGIAWTAATGRHPLHQGIAADLDAGHLREILDDPDPRGVWALATLFAMDVNGLAGPAVEEWWRTARAALLSLTDA